jgi:hypothetical protein
MHFFNNCRKNKQLTDLSRAKRIYFLNYANYMNMDRNGELDEYLKYKIPKTLEEEWNEIIIGDIFNKIITGEDVWFVSTLANIETDDQKIISCFQILAKSPHANEILYAIIKSEALFPSHLFKIVIELFHQ